MFAERFGWNIGDFVTEVEKRDVRRLVWSKYSDDEPRDDHGRWTDGGIGGGTTSAEREASAEKVATAQIKWTTSQKKNAALAADALRAAGFKAMTENPSGRKTNKQFAAIGSPTNGILVNPTSPFWKDPVSAAKHAFDVGHLSTDKPVGVLLHEIAHTIYDPPSNWMAPDQQRKVASEVSRYAATNPKEFVSEVFAGTKTGRTYSEAVMRLFADMSRNKFGERERADPRLALARRRGLFSLDAVVRYNPNHAPAGTPEGGQFTSDGEGGAPVVGPASKPVGDGGGGGQGSTEDVGRNSSLHPVERLGTLGGERIVGTNIVLRGGRSGLPPNAPSGTPEEVPTQATVDRVNAAFRRLPLEHLKAITKRLEVKVFKAIGPLGVFYEMPPGVPDQISIGETAHIGNGEYRAVESVESTAAHEFGHALDMAHPFQLSPGMRSAVNEDFANIKMETVPNRHWAAHHRENNAEAFAATYALKYAPVGSGGTFFGGFSREQAKSIFPHALAKLEDNLSKYL